MKITVLSAGGPQNARTKYAATTWPPDHHLITCDRTAAGIGDPRDSFYIKDILDYAFKLPGDIFCYVNNDVALATDWHCYVRTPVKAHGCCCSHRAEVQKFYRPYTVRELNGMGSYCGADFIAFTPEWWDAQRKTFPDVVIGLEGWDGVIQIIMRRHGFLGMPTICYHEAHGEPYWARNITGPANSEVRRRITEWAHRNGATQYLTSGSFLFKAMTDIHPPHRTSGR